MGGFVLVVKLGNVSISNVSLEYMDHPEGSLIRRGSSKKILALSDVSFEVNSGDVVALVGRNGSGKSSLLRLISGFIKPSRGSVVTHGRVILLAGVNPGFANEATGRQNVVELAMAYGIRDEEHVEFVESVIDFAEIGDAIDRRVKGYSAGMKGKLGFGFITSLRPDILLIDETLAVGDEEFRTKATKKLREFVKRSGSVVMSTHSLGLAREMCNRGLVLDHGKLIADEEVEEAMLEYRKILKSTDA